MTHAGQQTGLRQQHYTFGETVAWSCARSRAGGALASANQVQLHAVALYTRILEPSITDHDTDQHRQTALRHANSSSLEQRALEALTLVQAIYHSVPGV